MSDRLDLLVIGGGVNGCALARDAAGRGLRVALVERGDLAGATSGATSKLIHGGLRYLEHGELRMVRESLRERARLLAAAPHLVEPLRLLMPHDASLRPRWMLRLGLLLYDTLGGAGALPRSRAVDLGADPAGAALRPGSGRGFAFHDARTDDARLTLALARDAAARGAQVRTRCEVLGARRAGGGWEVRLQPLDAGGGGPVGEAELARAGALINAAGPWVLEAAARLDAPPPRARVRLVQGSHLVLRKSWEGKNGWLFQNPDRRVVFLLPWGPDLALLGTTDTPLAGPPESCAPRAEEADYLCRAAARWLAAPPRPEDALAAFAGVRPLFDDGRGDPARVTRDRRLLLDRSDPQAPVLHVFGGKLTTHRALAEEALRALAPWLPRCAPPWTAEARLPGAGRPAAAIAAELRVRHPGLAPRDAEALATRHGEEAFALAAGPPGAQIVPGLSEAELAWFLREEWARTADDVLYRRTRLGWTLDARARAAVAAAIRRPPSAPDRR